MERFDTSNKIICLIEMALKSEISWQTLHSAVNGLAPTLEKSKQIITILLEEFETHQSKCVMNRSNNGIDLIEFDDDPSIPDETKIIQQSNSEENIFEKQLQEPKKISAIENTKN